MTLEERIDLHDQWLLSMESNHSRMAADLAALSRKQDQLTDIVVTLAQNQGALFTAMGSLTSQVDRMAEHLRELQQMIERYIRFRGNGQQGN